MRGRGGRRHEGKRGKGARREEGEGGKRGGAGTDHFLPEGGELGVQT